MIKNSLLLLLILLSTGVLAQNYPKNYFIAPLDTPLLLTGTFGEVRNDHFHSGIDISTGEQEGLPVKAAADGYVSRIKISTDGFGRVLYVTHPNNYVTVYGHLKSFRADLQNYTISKQKSQQSYEIELFPKKDEFPVVKGEEIALSGNSGNTAGPHLHFEIREEKSERPLNPLLFGLPVVDNLPPQLRSVRIYPVMQNGIVEYTDSARSYEIFKYDTIYSVAVQDYIKVYGTCMFGFDVFDQQEGSTAELGIYSGELYVDGIKSYAWINDQVDFDETRYANAHSDYLMRKRDGINIERCFRLPGNFATAIYPDTNLTGYTEFTGDESHDIRFVARDFSGNTCEITFQVLAYNSLSSSMYQQYPEDALLVSTSKGIAVHKSNIDVVIPGGALYQEMYYTDDEILNNEALSNTFIVCDMYEVLHVPATISLKPKKEIADSLKSKAVIALVDFDGKMKSKGGTWNKDFLSGKSREFGRFIITLDTTPPSVRKEYYPADLNTSRGGIAQLIVDDNLSGLKSYSATIDGQWMLAEFDSKSKMLTIDLAGLPLNVNHKLELTVTDERGNKQIWKDEFWW